MKLPILLLLLLFGCVPQGEELAPNEYTIYFQFEYVNHAWGYHHQGFVVDQQGNVYEYNKPENWTFPEKDQISLDDFKKNLEQAEDRPAKLPETELNEMLSLALQASNGELSEKKQVMADAGEDSYFVFVARDGQQTLTRYLLQMRGDFYQKNTSAAADSITNWLIGIGGNERYESVPFDK